MNRRNFICTLGLGAISAPAIARLVVETEPKIRGQSLLDWVYGIRSSHARCDIMAGTDVVEFFREQLGSNPVRYSKATGVVNFAKFQVDPLPARYTQTFARIVPYITERTPSATRAILNPCWKHSSLELIRGFAGSTRYDALFDRKTMEITCSYVSALSANPYE